MDFMKKNIWWPICFSLFHTRWQKPYSQPFCYVFCLTWYVRKKVRWQLIPSSLTAKKQWYSLQGTWPFCHRKGKGNHKPTKNGLLKKENPTGSNKTKIRKIIDRTVMEANDFDHFLSLIKAQGIETDTGTSKNMVLLPNTNFRKKNIFTGAIPLVLFMGMNPSRNESKDTLPLWNHRKKKSKF